MQHFKCNSYDYALMKQGESSTKIKMDLSPTFDTLNAQKESFQFSNNSRFFENSIFK